jgi:Arc/MetJ family transcription regulator
MVTLHIEDWRVRTNIDIDDRLMRRAMRISGARTKKATVEAALQLLAQIQDQVGVRKLRGKVQWDGDLEQSRKGRNPA